MRKTVSNVHGKSWTKQKLYFSERHLSSVFLTCSYLIDLLQLRVCRCKATDVADIELSKIIFTPVNALGINLVNNQLTRNFCASIHLVYVTLFRCIDTIDSPDDEHGLCSKHVEKWNKCIRIVRQVGYLQDLYQDVRSAKHKFLLNVSALDVCVDLGLSSVREEHRLKVLEGRVG
jgi:hypothetical protein